MPLYQESLLDDTALLKAMLVEHSLQMEEQTRIVLDLRHRLEAKASEIDGRTSITELR